MIVGLGYKMRMGKDTVADYMVRRHGFIKMSFADALKEEVSNPERILIRYNKRNGELSLYYTNNVMKFLPYTGSLYEKIESYIEDNFTFDTGYQLIKTGSPIKDRRLLQLWGTDYRRVLCDRNYWVDRLREKIDKSSCKRIVISDMRFKNEFRFIEEKHGFTINVFGRVVNESGQNHSSENNLDNMNFEYNIWNGSTFQDLWRSVDQAVADMENRYGRVD